jgi:rhodanese-related sulfurtransferase
LQSLGIGKASALLGGYRAWQAEGHPVVRGDKPR